MLISQRMIPELKREGEMTRKLLARVPADKLDFKPAEPLHTIGWNASHLADIPGWLPGILAEPGMDLKTADMTKAKPAEAVATILETFDANLAKALAALEGATDDTMNQPWTMKMDGHEIFTMKKGDVLRKWIFSHTAHHRGILSHDLKLAGVNFSSIYEE